MTDRSGMFDPALTDAEAVEIRERYAAGGGTHRELAAEFGVSRAIIGCLIRGETYRHVGGPRTRPGGRRRLSEAEAVDIRERYAAGGVTHRELAAEFGVKRSTISYLIRGVTYQDAGGPHTPRWQRKTEPPEVPEPAR